MPRHCHLDRLEWMRLREGYPIAVAPVKRRTTQKTRRRSRPADDIQEEIDGEA